MLISKFIKWLLVGVAVITLTACGGGSGDGDNPTAREIAISNIVEYAQNGGTPPTVQDYLDAGVTGVTEDNLDEINEVVGNLTGEDVDTEEEIQALADELGIVLPDTTAPVIIVKGSANVSLVQGGTYTEKGATATDDRDGDLTANIVMTGTVDTATVGTYTIAYTVSDSVGNEASTSRTVVVTLLDTTLPVFTSSATASVNENQTDAITLVATDASAVTYSISGTDASDFSIDVNTGIVTFNVAPDYETKDSYTFTASATDASSNTMTQIVTITIVDVCEASAVTITHNGTDYKEVCSPYTKRIWLDRNLGAVQVCTRFDDTACYGDYYQWGRNFDGHQDSGSDTNDTQAADVDAAGADFITGNGDWVISGEDDNGSKRAANWSKTVEPSVCPAGFRVPTFTDLKAELTDAGSAEIANRDDAFNSFLKLPSAGYRSYTSGLANQGSYGYVWVNHVSYADDTLSDSIRFGDHDVLGTFASRANGLSVRCLKD